MKIFDSHTHINLEPLINEFNEITNYMNELQFGMNIVGVDINSSKIAIKQSYENKNFYCSVGVHPTEILSLDKLKNTINTLEKLCILHKEKIKCIGECGIDLHYQKNNLKEQIIWFEEQLKLAQKLDLILMIHVRDAYDELFNVLKKYNTKDMRIIIHCYTGDLEYALKFQSLGCYISFSGIITFKNAKELQNIITKINKSLIITETDAPWLSPIPFRGKVNYPYYIEYINTFIAKLFDISINECNKLIFNNIKKLFRL